MPTKRTRRSFGSISRLPSGRYRARYTGPDLAWHNAPHTYGSKVDAEGWLAAERRLIDLDQWTPPKERSKRRETSSRTVADAVADYISARDVRPGTVRNYNSVLKHRIVPYLGSTPVGKLTKSDVRSWVTRIRKEHPDTRSRNSQAYSLLASTMKREVEEGTVESSPCQVPQARRAPKPERVPLLTRNEYREILVNISDRYRLMTEVVAGCALRIGEATELRVSDVRVVSSDPLIVTVSISRTISWLVGGPVVGRPKSEAGIRTVAVPPHIAGRLNRHVTKRRRVDGKDALLFLNREGQQVRATKYREVFVRAATKAGRPDVSPHDLRHYGAVQAAHAGATVRELMDRLGHETPDMAVHYQHTAQGRDAEIAARMSEQFGDRG